MATSSGMSRHVQEDPWRTASIPFCSALLRQYRHRFIPFINRFPALQPISSLLQLRKVGFSNLDPLTKNSFSSLPSLSSLLLFWGDFRNEFLQFPHKTQQTTRNVWQEGIPPTTAIKLSLHFLTLYSEELQVRKDIRYVDPCPMFVALISCNSGAGTYFSLHPHQTMNQSNVVI